MSAHNRYKLAHDRTRKASEACYHWDYESRETGCGHECCEEYSNALRERELARKAYLKEDQS